MSVGINYIKLAATVFYMTIKPTKHHVTRGRTQSPCCNFL